MYTLEQLQKAINMAREIEDINSNYVNDFFTVDQISGLTEICTHGWQEAYSMGEIIETISREKENEVN